MKHFLTVASLMAACVAPALAESKHGWYANPGKPGTVDLWFGDTNVGTMDPFEGIWSFTGKNSVNMRKWVHENNPPKGQGALPAGISESSDKSQPEKAKKCKCCDGERVCKCKDGRKADDCPCEACECAIVEKPIGPARPLFGVKRSGLTPTTDQWSISGAGATKSEAMNRIAASEVPDDTGINRLTVIGSASARIQVMSDLENAEVLSYWKGKFVVKEYLPTHWRVTSGGFETPSSIDKAIVYVQSPNGTVLFRAKEWRGPDRFAKELRDRVPGYDASKDPGFKEPKPVGQGPLEHWRLAALASAVGFVVYRWRKQT